MEPKLLYLHIPKSGGTTLNCIFQQLIPASRRFYYDTLKPQKSIAEIKALQKNRVQRLRLIHGHFVYGFHKYIDYYNFKYFTVLRDPIERVISHYYYSKRKKNHYLYSIRKNKEFSLEEYVTSGISGEVQNGITKQIAGIYVNDNFGYYKSVEKKEVNAEIYEMAIENIKRDFAFVGFMEDFNSIVDNLKINLGGSSINYKFTIRNKNKNKIKLSENGGYKITENDRNIIKEYNKFDISLYNFCQEFEKLKRGCIINNKQYTPNFLEKIYLDSKKIINKII